MNRFSGDLMSRMENNHNKRKRKRKQNDREVQVKATQQTRTTKTGKKQTSLSTQRLRKLLPPPPPPTQQQQQPKQPRLSKIVAFFDGGARDNQAKQKSLVVAGSGTLLRDSVTNKVLTQRWDYLSNGNVPFAGFSLPPVTTNNAAEYVAVIAALVDAKQITQASELPIQLDVRGDSNLVVNQLLGAWRVKSDYLRPFYERALAEANALGKVVKPETFDNETSKKERGPERTRQMSLVTFRHIRRNLNAEADTLANRAMDERASGRL